MSDELGVTLPETRFNASDIKEAKHAYIKDLRLALRENNKLHKAKVKGIGGMRIPDITEDVRKAKLDVSRRAYEVAKERRIFRLPFLLRYQSRRVAMAVPNWMAKPFGAGRWWKVSEPENSGRRDRPVADYADFDGKQRERDKRVGAALSALVKGDHHMRTRIGTNPAMWRTKQILREHRERPDQSPSQSPPIHPKPIHPVSETGYWAQPDGPQTRPVQLPHQQSMSPVSWPLPRMMEAPPMSSRISDVSGEDGIYDVDDQRYVDGPNDFGSTTSGSEESGAGFAYSYYDPSAARITTPQLKGREPVTEAGGSDRARRGWPAGNGAKPRSM